MRKLGMIVAIAQIFAATAVADSNLIAPWRVTTGVEALCVKEGIAGRTDDELRRNCQCFAPVATRFLTSEMKAFLDEIVRREVEGITLTEARDDAYMGDFPDPDAWYSDNQAVAEALVAECPEAARAISAAQ